jgi:UDP-N-acetylmuramoylalanine--D-glutamate ligase
MIDLKALPINVKSYKVTVLGARRSGLAAARLLAQQGAKVLLSDLVKIEIPETVMQELSKHKIAIELGQHSEKVAQSDFVVLSPGIPNTAPIVREIEVKGIPIVSEIEMAYWLMPEAKVIAVTGSNGKTTTTTLIYELLKDTQYAVFCGGNIGVSFSSLIPDSYLSRHKPRIFVLEVSSFQLERIIHFRPDVAVVLNVTDDHMDRYEHDIHQYLKAKLNMTRNQQERDSYVYFADDALLKQNLPLRPRKMPFGLTPNPDMLFTADDQNIYTRDGKILIHRSEIALLGEHNLLNILASLNAISTFDIPVDHVRQVLCQFTGIEHRLEFVATIDNVAYYNDSKATNVDSVKYALKSFTQPVIVILGGRDKDADFSQLLPYLQKNTKKAILIGEAATKIQQVIKNVIPHIFAESMQAAVLKAHRLAQPGDVVLLSPACASFDMFENFEHRGKVFKEIVHSLRRK